MISCHTSCRAMMLPGGKACCREPKAAPSRTTVVSFGRRAVKSLQVWFNSLIVGFDLRVVKGPDVILIPEETVMTCPTVALGWREWLALPELGIPAIKAKIDTGARTSALHAFVVEPFHHGKQLKIRFGVHPLQKRVDIELYCEADVIDRCLVSDSGGHREWRYVIRTPVQMGARVWPIDITLTDRDTMQFRMLLGRTAMRQGTIVNPNASYLLGRLSARSYARHARSHP